MAPVKTGSANQKTANANARSLVFSHTVGGGNNQVLYVALMGLSQTVTSATYNGVAMTLISSETSRRIYRLINPPTGTYNVSFAWNLPTSQHAISVSYKDVEITLPNLSAVLGNGTLSNPSVTVTSGITSTILDFVYATRVLGISFTMADGAGQTLLESGSGVDKDGNYYVCHATEKAGDASTTMTHTLSPTTGTAWWQTAYSISPKTATTQNGFFFV
jgi:hypothetical protein